MTSRPPARAAAVAAALALAGVAGACSKDADLRLTTPPDAAPFMARYVALGNSITAGYQSGGINDSTQARAYPVLLARAAGVETFRVPALRRPGCAPPVVNFLTGVRTSGDTSSARCFGRADTSFSNVLNNLAVPGANSFDPIGLQGPNPTPSANSVTTLVLGGRSQVERALDVEPTFATVWIGNNDVLGFALGGSTAGATDSLAFITNYAATVGQLRSRNAGLRGVLIGVVDVTNTPLLVPISVFNPGGGGAGFAAYQPAANAAVTQIFGRPIQFAPNCAGSQAAVAFPALRAIAAGANAALPPGAPFTFVCNNLPGTTNTATQGVLDDAERAFFVARVAGWNAYIRAKADSIGFAYYDPNTLLGQARAAGQVPPFPILSSPTRPFGPLISNDGVHPGSPAHTLIARALVGVINAKYETAIDPALVPDQAP